MERLIIVSNFEESAECLCLVWFSWDAWIFDFLSKGFWQNFPYLLKTIVVLNSKLKSIFYLWSFFYCYGCLKISNLAYLAYLKCGILRFCNKSVQQCVQCTETELVFNRKVDGKKLKTSLELVKTKTLRLLNLIIMMNFGYFLFLYVISISFLWLVVSSAVGLNECIWERLVLNEFESSWETCPKP